MSTKTRRRVLADLDVVLLGKTGNGKSATGNSILWRKVFKALGTDSSVTQNVKPEFSEVQDYCIKVIDTPGLADTGLSEIQDKQRTVQSMTDVFLHCKIGVHVFLLVVRLDVRMTKEERDVFVTLRNIFGDRYLKDHGIVVVTHGDAFEDKMEEEELEMSFEEWFRQPDLGPIGELFAECEYRCVLFDNKTKVFETKNQQLKKLLEFAEQLRKKGVYTEGKFKESSIQRKKMMKKLKLPELTETIQRKIGLLQANISNLSQNLSLDDIKKAEDSLDDLLEEIYEEDEGTSLLDDLKKKVEELQNRCQATKKSIEENRIEEAKREAQQMKARALEIEENRQKALKTAWYASWASTVSTCLYGAAAAAALVMTGPVSLAVAGGAAAVGVVTAVASKFAGDKALAEASKTE